MTDILNSYYTPTHCCIVQKYTLIQDIFWRLMSEPTTGPSFFAPRHYPKRPAYARTAMPPAISTLTSYLNVKDCKGRTRTDDNSGTGTWPNGYGYGDDFLSASGTCTRLKSRRIRDGYFFPPVGNPTGTWYFTTVIILGCEQVKMCSFCYIKYDLFWLLNFATLLSQIFVEY
jgi:hypothetical protein